MKIYTFFVANSIFYLRLELLPKFGKRGWKLLCSCLCFWLISASIKNNKPIFGKVACIFWVEAQKLLASCLVFRKFEAQNLEKKVANKKMCIQISFFLFCLKIDSLDYLVLCVRGQYGLKIPYPISSKICMKMKDLCENVRDLKKLSGNFIIKCYWM